MNVIVIVTDTFRVDHLGCYGSEDVETPNLDRLAADGIMFTNTYADGLPTIPMRRVFHTGNSILPGGQWRPLLPDDVTVAEILSESGYTTGLIADTYHMFKPGMNFHQGFDSWEWIRGQENDKWRSGPRDAVDLSRYIPEHLRSPGWEERLMQYLLNMQGRESEEDYVVARTCQAAMRWLERNADNAPFMLWLELFDPHEPWDPPPRLREKHRVDYPVEELHFGYGVDKSAVREDDLPAIRALYRGEVEFVDEWVGRLIDHVDEMGLDENTVILFTSDHGTHLGEKGCIQKTWSYLTSIVAQLPLIARYPDDSYAGTRIDALTSGMDLAPTLMHLTGTEDHPPMDGENLWELVDGETASLHDWVLIRFRDFVAARTAAWHYFQGLSAANPGHGPALYDLNADPDETTNVVEEHPDVVGQMRELLSGCFELEGEET